MRINKRILGSLMLIMIFVAYHVSLFSFTHIHIVDGSAVTHSHPFTGNSNHCHSSAEFSFINSFASSLHYDIDNVNIDLSLINILSYVKYYYNDSIGLYCNYSNESLRSPPFYPSI